MPASSASSSICCLPRAPSVRRSSTSLATSRTLHSVSTPSCSCLQITGAQRDAAHLAHAPTLALALAAAASSRGAGAAHACRLLLSAVVRAARRSRQGVEEVGGGQVVEHGVPQQLGALVVERVVHRARREAHDGVAQRGQAQLRPARAGRGALQH